MRIADVYPFNPARFAVDSAGEITDRLEELLARLKNKSRPDSIKINVENRLSHYEKHGVIHSAPCDKPRIYAIHPVSKIKVHIPLDAALTILERLYNLPREGVR